MHFLMPQIFASHAQFKDWFHNPLLGMVEGQQEVNKVRTTASFASVCSVFALQSGSSGCTLALHVEVVQNCKLAKCLLLLLCTACFVALVLSVGHSWPACT